MQQQQRLLQRLSWVLQRSNSGAWRSAAERWLRQVRQPVAAAVQRCALLALQLLCCTAFVALGVRASALRWVIALMALDFPLLERPPKQTSEPTSATNWGGSCAPFM